MSRWPWIEKELGEVSIGSAQRGMQARIPIENAKIMISIPKISKV